MASDNHTIGPQKNCRLTIADCLLKGPRSFSTLLFQSAISNRQLSILRRGGLSKDLPERNRESGQQLGFFKSVSCVRTSYFGFELTRNVAIGESCLRVEKPHCHGSGGKVLRDLQQQVVGAVVPGDYFDHQIRSDGQRNTIEIDA